MKTLRPYQQTAKDAVFEAWKENQSTLVVMPTGTGKTVLFSSIIQEISPKRAIVLAHRSELIFQAAEHIEACGIDVEIEMGEMRAENSFWSKAPVIVSTVQTQVAGNNGDGRMAKFKPMDYGLVICDEAHHYVSPSFKRVLDYYRQNPDLKILGVTATPDRCDESALGQVFQSVAYDYEILDAILDGWLVPIRQQLVQIEGLDFSQMRTTAGDLNGADLAAVMEAEENLHGIASSTLEIIGDKRTIVFTASVKQAEMLSNIFNRHRSDMSKWVCGHTHKQERKDMLEDFSKGKTQVIVNVGVLTEGFDNPGVECIVQARPTKSRCLYSQMVGRATRPLAGIVDLYHTPEERKQAIANSPKPSMLIIDFAGNSGRHKLITTADILGGKYNDDEIEMAERRAKESGQSVDMTEELEKARQELLERKRLEEANRRKLVGKAIYRSKNVDPFNTLDIEPERERGWDSGKVLSEKQKSVLMKMGINPDDYSYHQCCQLVGEQVRRWTQGLCTMKQAKLLKKHGYETKDMTMKDASAIIDKLAQNWRRR